MVYVMNYGELGTYIAKYTALRLCKMKCESESARNQQPSLMCYNVILINLCRNSEELCKRKEHLIS